MAGFADFDEGIRLQPGNSMAYSNRASTLRDIGEHARALADYNDAIRLDPNNQVALVNRGILYMNFNAKHARADFNSVLARLPPGDPIGRGHGARRAWLFEVMRLERACISALMHRTQRSASPRCEASSRAVRCRARRRRSCASADRRQQAPDFVEQFGNRRLVTREVLNGALGIDRRTAHRARRATTPAACRRARHSGRRCARSSLPGFLSISSCVRNAASNIACGSRRVVPKAVHAGFVLQRCGELGEETLRQFVAARCCRDDIVISRHALRLVMADAAADQVELVAGI